MESAVRVIELNRSLTDSNERDAADLRDSLRDEGVLLINIMSSPGAGKTTLLSRTIEELKDRIAFGVIEADIASAVDAHKLSDQGIKCIQMHTGGMCHVDAGMTRKALKELDIMGEAAVFLENVGNLICPAEYDTGAHLKVMLLSIPEGDDKPLKYPLMFSESDALVITKKDTAEYFSFDVEKCLSAVKRLNPDIKIFILSAVTGEGMSEWEEWLSERFAFHTHKA